MPARWMSHQFLYHLTSHPRRLVPLGKKAANETGRALYVFGGLAAAERSDTRERVATSRCVGTAPSSPMYAKDLPLRRNPAAANCGT